METTRGIVFTSFKPPVLPPAVPEGVVELFQQSQTTSAVVSGEVSRAASVENWGASELQEPTGSTYWEAGTWKVQNYVDCKEVIVHILDEEHCVSIKDCAGYKAPTVVIVRGICRNLAITNCINVVVIMDGATGSASLNQVLELSLYFCGYCPSPLTLREIDGLQFTAVASNLHCSISVTKGDDIFFKCVDDGYKPQAKKQQGWRRATDSDSEDEAARQRDKLVSGGGLAHMGHMMVLQRRHVQLPAKQVITLPPAFTTPLPREGVFVLQDGRLTKSADAKGRGVLTHAPQLLYNGVGNPLAHHAAHPPGHELEAALEKMEAMDQHPRGWAVLAAP